jgi:tetratricopeptide (TPR) repeat protein
VTILLSGKTLTYENLPLDSLIEIEVQSSKEVQVSIIMDIERGETIKVYSGLYNSLFSYGGVEVISKTENDITLKALETKIILQIYGTFNKTYSSTIVFLFMDKPLLLIRSKSSDNRLLENEERFEIEKKLSEIEQLILQADLPSLRKDNYTARVLKIRILLSEGKYLEALKSLSKIFDDIQNEQLKYKNLKTFLEIAIETLETNRMKLPAQRLLDAESQIKLALLAKESGDYEKAEELAKEAKKLATWTNWDELIELISRISPFIIGIAIIILLIFLLYFSKRKFKEKQTIRIEEGYGE